MNANGGDFWYQPKSYKWTIVNNLFNDMSWIETFDGIFRNQLLYYMQIHMINYTNVVRAVKDYEEKRKQYA